MLIGLLILLNSIDALATYFFVVKIGAAKEANPLMAGLINLHPGLFLFTKLILVNILMYRLYHSPANVNRQIAVIILLIFYGLITCQHLRILYYWLHQ